MVSNTLKISAKMESNVFSIKIKTLSLVGFSKKYKITIAQNNVAMKKVYIGLLALLLELATPSKPPFGLIKENHKKIIPGSR